MTIELKNVKYKKVGVAPGFKHPEVELKEFKMAGRNIRVLDLIKYEANDNVNLGTYGLIDSTGQMYFALINIQPDHKKNWRFFLLGIEFAIDDSSYNGFA